MSLGFFTYKFPSIVQSESVGFRPVLTKKKKKFKYVVIHRYQSRTWAAGFPNSKCSIYLIVSYFSGLQPKKICSRFSTGHTVLKRISTIWRNVESECYGKMFLFTGKKPHFPFSQLLISRSYLKPHFCSNSPSAVARDWQKPQAPAEPARDFSHLGGCPRMGNTAGLEICRISVPETAVISPYARQQPRLSRELAWLLENN